MRRDSRATAIVMAAASTARPMTCPPMSRTSSGRPAERSIILVECPWLRVAVAPEADGDGDTCGNAEPRSPVGWTPRPARPETVPVGRLFRGNVPPSPAFCVWDEESLWDDFFRLTSTVADADAEFDASAEVAVAVSVT